MSAERPTGWFSDAEGAAYNALCGSIREGRIAEVGVYLGRSLSFVIQTCTENRNEVFAVDRWMSRKHKPGQGDDLKTQFLAWKKEHDSADLVRPVQGDSSDVAKQFEDHSLDLVMLDAKHSYRHVAKDIQCWAPKVRVGGHICGHDYSDTHPGVMKAVDEHLAGPDEVADSFWWKRVPEGLKIPRVPWTAFFLPKGRA